MGEDPIPVLLVFRKEDVLAAGVILLGGGLFACKN